MDTHKKDSARVLRDPGREKDSDPKMGGGEEGGGIFPGRCGVFDEYALNRAPHLLTYNAIQVPRGYVMISNR
jgi:hypothetical protein